MPTTGDALPPVWRRPTPLLIAAAAVIAIMLAWGATHPRYVLNAGDVTVTPAGITGTFRMDQVNPVLSAFGVGIYSEKVGGACLALRPQDIDDPRLAGMVGLTCSNSQQCQDKAPPGVAGYCAPDNKCWAKLANPGDPGSDSAMCHKNISLQPGTTNTVPVDPLPLTTFALNKKAQARVIACLNGHYNGFATAKAPCAIIDHPNRIEVMGTPQQVN